MSQDYIQKINTNLNSKGFSVQQNVDYNGNMFDIVGHRARLEFKMASFNDYFFIVKRVNEASTDNVSSFSTICYEYAKQRKHRTNILPRGIFGGFFVFTIMLSDTVPEAVSQTVTNTPLEKHWASTSIPVLINVQTGKVDYYQGQVIWGSGFWAGFKKLISEITS